MREGVSRDGSHLFPAFPYYAFTKLSDHDIESLYAYFMTLPAGERQCAGKHTSVSSQYPRLPGGVEDPVFQKRTVPRPIHQRATNGIGEHTWRKPLRIARAVTLRAIFSVRKRHSNPYAGYEVDGWIAPPLTAANPSPIPWTEKELFKYLRTGASPLHGATAATMTEVIRDSLALPIVPDSDVRAIAVYFADMDHASARVAGIAAEYYVRRSATSSLGSGQEDDPDADLYASACISCHYNAGPVPLPARPELSLNSALTLPEPTNFIQAVLKGVGDTEGAPGLVMPEYASSLSDGEIARLAAYLRRTRTKSPPWTNLENKVAVIRRASAKSR